MFTFEKAIPEQVGVSSINIKNVLKTLDEKNIPMHSLLIMKDDKLIFEKYYAPYKADTLHRMFSISKSFTAVAIELLAMEGKIDIDSSITDYYPEYVNEKTHPWIRMTTIRNMLQMRTCHAASTYKVNMKSDWVESFFTVPPTHKPGTVFHYDTSAAHTLCALVEKISGMEMLTYMKEKMLKYVDFSSSSYMIKDPFGVSMGGSGLMATPMDVLKFLYILSHQGKIVCNDQKERVLISEDFVLKATSNISDNYATGPLPSEMQGYGIQIWQIEKGGFVLYGMGGQLGICIPGMNMLIMTTADTQGMQGGNQVIYNAIYDNLMKEPFVSSSKSDYENLIAYSDSLMITPPRLPESYSITKTFSKEKDIPLFIKGLGKSLVYSLDENKSGFDTLYIELNDDDTCFLKLGHKDELYTIGFKLGSMYNGSFPIYGTPYTAGAMFSRDNVLYIRAHLIGECVGSVRFQIFFEEREVTVYMRKIEETYFGEFDGHLHGTIRS